MKLDQEIVISFINSLPDGKTVYPLDLVINKMGSNIEINMKLRLRTTQENKA